MTPAGVLLTALIAFVAAGFTPFQMRFEVASVKRNPVLKGDASRTIDPEGIMFTRVTLSDCIQAAYGLKPHQISGPDWLRSERYDISARTAENTSKDQMMLMFQTLLNERFKMKVHREQKEVPVYALVVAKSGHRLHPSEGEGSRKILPASGGMEFRNASMADLGEFLGGALAADRPVLDRTGLKERFDFTLAFLDPAAGADVATVKGAMRGGDVSIFADALDRLGLKLEFQKIPTDVLVIDHAEKVPVEN